MCKAIEAEFRDGSGLAEKLQKSQALSHPEDREKVRRPRSGWISEAAAPFAAVVPPCHAGGSVSARRRRSHRSPSF
jgi:hypothetical protein